MKQLNQVFFIQLLLCPYVAHLLQTPSTISALCGFLWYLILLLQVLQIACLYLPVFITNTHGICSLHPAQIIHSNRAFCSTCTISALHFFRYSVRRALSQALQRKYFLIVLLQYAEAGKSWLQPQHIRVSSVSYNTQILNIKY